MRQMIGYCGLDCEKCDAYIATVNNDDALREKTATLWSQLNNIEITASVINCSGCRTEGIKTYFCDNLCEIRRCAQSKGLETCGECAVMEVCKTVAEIHRNNEAAKKNLK